MPYALLRVIKDINNDDGALKSVSDTLKSIF